MTRSCRWRHIAWTVTSGWAEPALLRDDRWGTFVDKLIVRGAREHNLKDVSLDLPRDALIVFTGLSGSGKSSLAFDTIFAEGQRRYVESLSAYARQFLGQMDKPDVDFIEGLSPGGLDRPEVDQPQPAVDGRHDHRGLRLPAAAVRPRRAAALPGLRRAGQPADPAADRRPGARAATRAPGSRCSRRSSAAARASTASCSASCRPRATAGPGSTARRCRWPSRPSSTRSTSTRSTSSSTGSASRPSAKRRLTDSVETALGLAGGLVTLDFVDLPEKDQGPRAPVLREARLPQRPPAVDGRARAAVVLVQLAVRRLPRVHRPRHQARGRPRAARSPTTRCRSAEGAVAPWAQRRVVERVLPAGCSRRWPRT